MTQFSYTAVPLAGGGSSSVAGQAKASDERTLRETLRAQGLVLIEARPVRLSDAIRAMFEGSAPRRADGAWFFATLRQLLEGKVPVESAVQTMGELAPNARLRAVCTELRDALRSGASFADAVESVDGLAKPAHLALLRAGQSSGRLGHAVGLVDRSIENASEIRRSVMGKLAYPIVLLCASIVSLWVLSTYVIPKFAETLASVGQELPLSTRFTLAASDVLVWAVPIAVILAILAVALRDRLLSESMKTKLAESVLRVPALGALVAHRESAIACDLTATMLEGGGDLITGLEQASGAMGNRVIRERLDRARAMVREGRDLGEALKETDVLPPMIAAVVTLGTRTGDLTGALRRATDLSVAHSQRTVQRLLMMMEPGVILFLGGTVGWVVYSLIAGMLAMNEAGSL
ncbi:MAG: type II secretion system F family protein [Phycisphaerales bacterium]